MPLRARLRNSGLKLKIPVRPTSTVTNSPYAGGNRHSASPGGGRRGESRTRPDWPSEAPREEKASSRVDLDTLPPTVPYVHAFDAAVDTRPVWAVSANRPKTTTDGFRAIPIQRDPVGERSDCDILLASSPSRADDDSEPESPELASINPQFRSSPLETELQLLSQRARHLREWFYQLSPGGGATTSEGQGRDSRRPSYSYSARYLSSPVPRFRSRTCSGRSPSSSVATSNDSILTPTENLDNPLGGGSARRDSQGVLQSPEDGFYLLKKDSQRRATLGKILKDDKHRICKEWHSLLVKDVHDFCLTEQHLSTLVEGMKGYIEGSKNSGPLQKAVQDLRNDLDYDGAGLNHLQLALYKVPEALNKVLRGHSIKPHWMFALEDLVRTAVQEAIVILSPELGVHLGSVSSQDHHMQLQDHDHPDHQLPPQLVHAMDDAGGSTSGVSTVSQRLGQGAHGVLNSLGRLREENRHLLTDLMRAQESYQELLRQSLSEQRLHLQMLSNSLAASSLSREPVQRQAGVVDIQTDPDLVEWLEKLNLNQDSMDKILNEDLTLNDMLELMSREDLKGLGLKAGPELRVWRAILTHRKVPLTPTP